MKHVLVRYENGKQKYMPVEEFERENRRMSFTGRKIKEVDL